MDTLCCVFFLVTLFFILTLWNVLLCVSALTFITCLLSNLHQLIWLSPSSSSAL